MRTIKKHNNKRNIKIYKSKKTKKTRKTIKHKKLKKNRKTLQKKGGAAVTTSVASMLISPLSGNHSLPYHIHRSIPDGSITCQQKAEIAYHTGNLKDQTLGEYLSKCQKQMTMPKTKDAMVLGANLALSPLLYPARKGQKLYNSFKSKDKNTNISYNEDDDTDMVSSSYDSDYTESPN